MLLGPGSSMISSGSDCNLLISYYGFPTTASCSGRVHVWTYFCVVSLVFIKTSMKTFINSEKRNCSFWTRKSTTSTWVWKVDIKARTALIQLSLIVKLLDYCFEDDQIGFLYQFPIFGINKSSPLFNFHFLHFFSYNNFPSLWPPFPTFFLKTIFSLSCPTL